MPTSAPYRATHLPDPNMITLSAESGHSRLHGLDPRAKVGALAWLVILVTLAQPVWFLLLVWAGTVAVYALAGLPLRELLRWYILPTLFVLSLVILLIWGEPGGELVSAGGLELTTGGVMLAVTLLARALAGVTLTLAVLMTTRYAFMAAMVQRGLPAPIDQIFLLSYRFLFTTMALVDNLLLALRARGGGLTRGVLTRTRLFAGIFALSFLRSYDRADHVSRAMAARGYAGHFAPAEPLPPPSRVQLAVVTVAFVVLGAAAAAGLPGLAGGVP
ncbi:MAG: energy-coupling factor transporter transmembrane component T [Methanospirillum sp.]